MTVFFLPLVHFHLSILAGQDRVMRVLKLVGLIFKVAVTTGGVFLMEKMVIFTDSWHKGLP